MFDFNYTFFAKNLKVLLLGSFCFFLLGSCKKNERRIKSYVGKYQGLYTQNSYGDPILCGNIHSSKDTIFSVNYGSTDSTIAFLGIEICPDENGNYTAYHSSFSISNQHLSFYSMNGGLGCGVNIAFEGDKISDNP